MGDGWREHFSVDIVNGTPGNELKFDNRRLVANYLRVGFEKDGSWRTFGLRKDFHPAEKQQVEDDITASVVVPTAALQGLNSDYKNPSIKFIKNCEYRLFQRPDDAIHRGYDKLTEAEFTRPGNFFSNYEPLTVEQARDLADDSIRFDKFTLPMQTFIRDVAASDQPSYFVCTAQPRIVDGEPSKNPRYLQTRPDLLDARSAYLAEMGVRLWRRLPLDQPLHLPVNAVLPGRRNNPSEPNIRSLAVFNPIHYLELPELFMEFICSMTGKSPSTTGAGSEGVLTKGPFNALPPIIDLNNALVSYLLTNEPVFITAAGYVGPQVRVDHDISLLVPELWCRMSVQERDPKFLVEHGYLERCRDFSHSEQPVLASRLGYRITMRFVINFFGRVFNHPHLVFTDKMLRPETQDYDIFADGMDNIVETHQRVAKAYFDDGSIENACPPLKALLHIMARNEYGGKGLDHPEIREMFTREHLLASDWYAQRLAAKQASDLASGERHVTYLKTFLHAPATRRKRNVWAFKIDWIARASTSTVSVRTTTSNISWVQSVPSRYARNGLAARVPGAMYPCTVGNTDSIGEQPGKFPFTRGVHATMYRGKLWTMRQYPRFGTAQETSKRYRYLFRRARPGLSMAFDLPTQIG